MSERHVDRHAFYFEDPQAASSKGSDCLLQQEFSTELSTTSPPGLELALFSDPDQELSLPGPRVIDGVHRADLYNTRERQCITASRICNI